MDAWAMSESCLASGLGLVARGPRTPHGHISKTGMRRSTPVSTSWQLLHLGVQGKA